jgi:hypothetical protein
VKLQGRQIDIGQSTHTLAAVMRGVPIGVVPIGPGAAPPRLASAMGPDRNSASTCSDWTRTY